MSELRSKLSGDIRSIGQANAVVESVLAHIRVRPVIACRVFGMPSAPALRFLPDRLCCFRRE